MPGTPALRCKSSVAVTALTALIDPCCVLQASGGGDGGMASSDDIPPSLEADFVVLRKLRDESERDELDLPVGAAGSERGSDFDAAISGALHMRKMVNWSVRLVSRSLPKFHPRAKSGPRPPRPSFWTLPRPPERHPSPKDKTPPSTRS